MTTEKEFLSATKFITSFCAVHQCRKYSSRICCWCLDHREKSPFPSNTLEEFQEDLGDAPEDTEGIIL